MTSFYREQKLDTASIKTNEITLSDILNVLDGTLQNSGRVMIVTTKHPEKLDRALIRAGRFDCKCSFELRNMITDNCPMQSTAESPTWI